MSKHIKNEFCNVPSLLGQGQAMLHKGTCEANGIAFMILISLVICSPE